MSEKHESDETLLPDDADRKIEELMASLRESELLGDPSPEEESRQEETEEEGYDAEEEFLTDEESDFVDLDAEQLDNSTDKLELDESDTLGEAPPQELGAVVEPPADEVEELDSSAAEQQALAANELARARLDELEEKLAEVEASPLQVSAPAGRPSGSWVSAALALLAVVLSGAALWMSYNSPSAPASAVAASGGSEVELQRLKGDLAALRERISSVEKQAAQDNAEALAMLDRMEAVLARVETTIVNGAASAETAPAQDSGQPAGEGSDAPPAAVAGDPQLAAKAPPPSVAAKPEAAVATEVAAPAGKVFVKGWAVNLRSYYHRVDAERLMQRLRQAGIDAEIREIPKGEVTWHRVRVMGFASKQEANAFIEGLSEEQGRELAWPSYYQGYVEH